MGSCSDDPVAGPSGNPGLVDGTLIDMVAGVEFPEMQFGISRAMGEYPSAEELLNSLYVNVFVFDRAGVMMQFIEPKDVEVLRIDPENHHVYFKVSNIYSSSEPRRLHFVVTSAEDLTAEDGGDYIKAMASETTTMPALVVSGDTDAYWGVTELDEITADMSLTIRLVRNFVKLSVSVDNLSNPGDFKLLGYTVVNRPGRGTVTPYRHQDHLFAAFFNAADQLLTYEQVIEQGYYGVNTANADADMTFTTASEVETSLQNSITRMKAGEDTPYYIYERSQSSVANAGSDVMVTYMIVAGEYKGQTYYYKIDIGRDSAGKFGYYDLLRNFRYTVDIKEVGGAGALSVQDAMNGAAHNNLSASVVTRDLFSIGYDNEIIEVSATRVIFTEQTAGYELRFRYTIPNKVDYTFDPRYLKVYDVADESREYNCGNVAAGRDAAVDLSGEVLEKASLSKDGDWYVLKVTSRDVPADSRRYEQSVRIYYSGGNVGLGRTVTFMLRRPWNFSNMTCSNPGQGLGSDLNLSFDIPSGLPNSLFPLILTFESDKQNIYAVNGSPLTVQTGQSAFAGATTDNVIYYEWRLEWADYAHTDGSEGGRYTVNFKTNTTSTDDVAYPTSSIDNASNGSRTKNNGSSGFCIRVANKGYKYIEPIYFNLSRPR